MFANSNLITPLKHYICELLEIPYNIIGVQTCIIDILETYIIDIFIGHQYQDAFIYNSALYEEFVRTSHKNHAVMNSLIELHNIIVEKGKYEWLKNKVIEEYRTREPNIGPCDNSVINYVLYEFFELESEKLSDDFFENLSIDIKYLCSQDKDECKPYFKKIKYRQMKPIPRSYLQKRFFHKEVYIIIHSCIYNIDLLDEPFIDNDT